jgi:hypothetical protein
MKYARTVIISALLLMATSLAAQCQERQIVIAAIPFAFTVENTALPAGTYTISTLYPYNMIKVRSVDGRRVAWIAAIPSSKLEGAQRTKLVFHRFDDEYFLVQVWEQGSKVHRDLRNGNRVLELVRSGDGKQYVTVLVNAGSNSN